MKKLFLLPVIVLFGMQVMAQKAIIEFEKLKHDFGTFKEEAGPQTFRFEFTNKGKEDLLIQNASASCGCTTPNWSKEAIKPGKKGFVEAQYNPAGRPGPFEKTVTVTSNAENPTVILTIKGNATERVKTPADLYPKKIGELRVLSEYFNMGRVSPTGSKTEKFKIYNEGDKNIELSFPATASHIKITATPATLKPKETGEIKVDYDGTFKKDYGYTNDGVTMNAKGNSQENVQLYVVCTIEDEPKKLSPEEAEKAPKLKFEKKDHDFGTIRPGEVVAYEFKFNNSGKEMLKINKTKASCGCTASDPAKKELVAGEGSSIKVTFNSAGKHDGPQSQTVTIYSNDPQEPTQYISIRANVDSKKKEEPNLLAKPAPMAGANVEATPVAAPAKPAVEQTKPAGSTKPAKGKAGSKAKSSAK